jgi:FAD/FMN-containing dehydrogenase
MAAWSNWSGRHQARPQALHFIRSEADASGLVRQAAASGLGIRIAGAGHSHSLLVPHDGIVVDASGLAGVISTDAANQTAWVWAGSRIYSLGRPLHDVGLALKNQGDIDRQAIAGACATGTHGTGRSLENLSAAVIGAQIVLASGEQMVCSANENAEAWQVARLSLGAVGIVTRLNLQLRESYKLRESGFQSTFEELQPRVDRLAEENGRFEFFWYPQSDEATVKIINETNDEPEYPIAAEGQRVGWNYEVLPSHRPHFHTEMEYSVPAEQGLECLGEIRELLRTKFTDVAWPVEYRTVAEDDVWLSMAHGRPTVTISVHQDVRLDETAYYRACEAIFDHYDGRPHWGKVNYLDGRRLAARYPRWEDWWRVRDALDPGRVFLNAYMKSIAP